MGSDRARVSYDERRQWRSVVRQQGRVTLEADEKEADDIASEELRLVNLDNLSGQGGPGFLGGEIASVMVPQDPHPLFPTGVRSVPALWVNRSERRSAKLRDGVIAVYVAGAPTSVCLERASLHDLDAARAPAPIGGLADEPDPVGRPGGTPWEYVLPPGATWRD